MKIDYIKCDECKKEARGLESLEISIALGREMDPSGNGYVDNLKHLDVCPACVTKIVKQYFQDKEFDKALLLFEENNYNRFFDKGDLDI